MATTYFVNFNAPKGQLLSTSDTSAMEEASARACVDAGPPLPSEYNGSGHEYSLDDLDIYEVGEGDEVVIVAYDIFGFKVANTRRICDTLADGGLRAVMPDFYRGQPWSLANFPPPDFKDLMAWMKVKGNWDIVKNDLDTVVNHLKLQGCSKFGVLGFCWGGKQAVTAASDERFSACAAIHGAMLNEDDAKTIQCPVMLCPSKDDPSVDPLKKILDERDFANECVYRRFDDQIHGFCAARGDWNVLSTRQAALEAIRLSVNFFTRHLKLSVVDRSADACIAAGPAVPSDYSGEGKEDVVDGLPIYEVGANQGAKAAVIVAYDIFGFKIGNTRYVCDKLAESGLHVAMPDFYRGNPWLMVNFPPKDRNELMSWLGEVGTTEIVNADINRTIEHLKHKGVDKFGIVGFCWGGKQAMLAAADSRFSAAAGIHAAFLQEDDAKAIQCPVMLLPSKDDPSVIGLKKILDDKDFGTDCVYRRFDDQIHGWCAARGDWKVFNVKQAADEAIQLSVNFFGKHLLGHDQQSNL